MSKQLADQFIQALHDLETARKVESIVGLFAENCEVGNIVSPHHFQGTQGAHDFWQNYRATFGEVQSSFRNEIVMDGRIALEWTTEGTNPHGKPLTYDGVSILETQNGKITRFFAYFDPKHLGEEITK
jgi:ketosteroid isomerase-like protein